MYRLYLVFFFVLLQLSVFSQPSLHITGYNIDSYPEVRADFFAFDDDYQFVDNLSASSFSISDNGTPVQAVDVSCGAQSPIDNLSLVITTDLAVNTDGDIGSNFEKARNLVIEIIKLLDTTNSQCALSSFDVISYLDQDFTKDKDNLIEIVGNYQPKRGSYFDAGLLSHPSGAIDIARTGIFDKAILLITDGAGSADRDSIVQAAIENDIRIFAVSLGIAMADDLKYACENTGGHWFFGLPSEEDEVSLARIILAYINGYAPCTIKYNGLMRCPDQHDIEFVLDLNNSSSSISYEVNDEYKPHIVATPDFLGFGAVLAPGTKKLGISIQALNADILVDSLEINDNHFTITSGDNTGFTIRRDELHSLEIEYTATDSAIVFADLIVHTSDACYGTKIPITAGFPNTPPLDRTIELVWPICDETMIVGDTVYIEWRGLLPRDVIQLEYSINGGIVWDTLTLDVDGLKYEWVVPDRPSEDCLVRAIQLWPNNIGRTMDFPHNLGVNSAMFSTDYNKIITCSDDSTARIWNSNNGKELLRLFGHTQPVIWGDFSPDDKLVVTASDDSTARIWDAETGDQVRILEGHTDKVRSANFSPDGSRIVTASKDGYSIVWETNTGNPIDTVEYSTNQLWFANYSTSGDYILVAGNHPAVKMWSVAGDTVYKEFNTGIAQGGQGLNVHAALSRDGNKLVTSSWFGKSIVWDTQTMDTITTVSHIDTSGSPSAIFFADFDPTGDTLLTSGFDHKAIMWEANTGEYITTLMEHSSSVRSGVFNFDGSRVLTSSWDFTAKIWNRDKRDLQMDTSDCPFRITRAVIETPQIVFGKVPFGEVVDTIVTAFIENKTGYPFEVYDIRITGYSQADYSILNGHAPYILDSNETKSLELRFRPTNFGIRPANMEIIIPDDTVVTEIIGEGIQYPLDAVTPAIDFLNVDIGDYKDSLITVIVKNRWIDPIFVDSTVIRGPDDENFDIVKGEAPLRLNPDQEHSMTLRFTPGEVERKSGQLHFYHDAQASPTRILLFGKGVVPIIDTAHIFVGTASGKPGDIVEIPVYLDTDSDGIQSSISGFKADFRFNSTLLEPLAPVALVDKIEDNDRLMTIEMPLVMSSDTALAILRFRAGLGNDTISPVLIDNITPIGLGKIVLSSEHGSFTLRGVCQEGGMRLFESDGILALQQNWPNPFDINSTIQFSAVEKGRHVLSITDVMGVRVKTLLDSYFDIGKYSVEVNTSGLPSGFYYYTLKTPTQTLTRRMQVSK